MCDGSFGENSGVPEPKALKEACSAVKEAAAVYSASRDNGEVSAEEIVIKFEQMTDGCSK